MRRLLLALPCMVAAWSAALPAAADPPSKQECVAANESAQDLQHAGKLREARARLAVCIADTCPGAVREDCGQRLADVDRSIPTIVFDAKDAAGNDVSAVRVSMDGQALADKLVGTPIAVDPGEHKFVFEVQGAPPVSKVLVLHEGERNRREKVVIALGGHAAQPAPAEATTDQVEVRSEDGKNRRLAGLVVGGVGAVGVIVGGIAGIASKYTYDGAMKNNCGSALPGGNQPATVCNQDGVDAVDRAKKEASIATVGMLGGAVLLGVGAYLYFTAPKENAATVAVAPSLGPGAATLTVRGSF
jgi:hypothetical protein